MILIHPETNRSQQNVDFQSRVFRQSEIREMLKTRKVQAYIPVLPPLGNSWIMSVIPRLALNMSPTIDGYTVGTVCVTNPRPYLHDLKQSCLAG